LRRDQQEGEDPSLLCRDGQACITPELEARIDEIACGMPEFHYGRFELRFASTDDLMRGDNFSIIGISGIESWASDGHDPSLSLSEIYRRLVEQQRIMFLIGDKNRSRGFKPIGCGDILKALVRQSQLSRHYSVEPVGAASPAAGHGPRD
jgi:hypothetical protein